MIAKQAVVFGAGKIARGFIAHLLTLSGYRITFVEKNPDLLANLRARGRYTVTVMGAEEKSIVIEGYEALSPSDAETVAARVADAAVVFSSVGGPNLPSIAPLLADGLRKRSGPANVLICENYFQPAQLLRERVEQCGCDTGQTGFVETMVLRSCIEGTPEMKAQDPLALKVQDMWELPADKEAFVGNIPEIVGLAPKENFQGGLLRKLFTYNATNAVISYVGHLKGYRLLAEAANDAEIVTLARRAAAEVAPALCRKFGFDAEDQRRFAESAIAKYQKHEIVDPIERNARDPVRKLGRNDRLVGPASMAVENGVQPKAFAYAIAAALRYDHPGDPSSRKLQELLQSQGLGSVLEQICGIDPAAHLASLITAAHQELG